MDLHEIVIAQFVNDILRLRKAVGCIAEHTSDQPIVGRLLGPVSYVPTLIN